MEKAVLTLWKRNRFEFWCESKSWIFWALSVNFALTQPKAESFFQSRTTSRKLSIGNLMGGLRLVITKKNSLKEMILHYQEQVFEELENQNSKSKIAAYDCAIQSFCWSLKYLFDTLMEQIKTEFSCNQLNLSIETIFII